MQARGGKWKAGLLYTRIQVERLQSDVVTRNLRVCYLGFPPALRAGALAVSASPVRPWQESVSPSE